MLVIMVIIFAPKGYNQPEKVVMVDLSIVTPQTQKPAPESPPQQTDRKKAKKVVEPAYVVPDTLAANSSTHDPVETNQSETDEKSVDSSTVDHVEAASLVSGNDEEIPQSGSNVIGTGKSDSNVVKAEYVSVQYGVIRDMVYKRLSYPSLAQAEEWEGTVKIRFLVKCDGNVDSIRIQRSSGYSMLDNSAVKAVREAAPFPKAPFRLEIVLPVVFRLQ